ncbi:MotA/TolQ/ExbB proton channel family protein [Gryllotalpicola sp.]|uniref:motility protein A n=1 Tax=Gryllotalpicola sp. TaxID=1932787 RepID=UPI00262FD5B2|nr:MotA/TolQ/ExbB proton channel family protein [Gryllotalpicola sp.]
MDIALLVGLIGAFGSVVAMLTLEGSSVTSIILPAPMIMVLGATIAVSFGSGTLSDFLVAMKSISTAFRGKVEKPTAVIDQLVGIAEKARREGLLSLESDAAEAKDPFLKNALQNVADGVGEEELRTLLDDEIATKDRVGKASARWFKMAGGYAPTIGIIGTVISLTHVLANLSDPGHLGPMIASAFVATLWGLLSANFIWLPIGDRLSRVTELETQRRQMILEAVLAVQAGAGPRLLSERLQAMIPNQPKPKDKDLAKAA